jgi:hypothetical protein
MGLDIRLYNVTSSNPFTLSYKTGLYVGSTTTGFTSYSVGSDLGGGVYYASTTGTTSGTLRNYNTNPIIFTGASFDTQYWFKIVDSVTSGYTISNIITHEICYYPCANCGTLTVNLECVGSPTPTPTPTVADCGTLTVNLTCL